MSVACVSIDLMDNNLQEIIWYKAQFIEVVHPEMDIRVDPRQTHDLYLGIFTSSHDRLS